MDDQDGASRLSRRALLRALGVGAISIPSLSALIACEPEAAGRAGAGSTGGAASPSPAESIDWEAWWAEQRIAGELDFANWPYYIDRTRDSSHPSLDRFQADRGIAVTYTRPIRENAQFLDKIRPALRAGEPIGYDLIVITNGPELSELINSGWVTPLDHSRLPNFARYAGPHVRGPLWDPDNTYSVAWQSGLTGIAYSPEAAEAIGGEPTSIQDLWNPALAGKVGMMSDLVELGNAGLLAVGVDPSISTPDSWRTAADMLRDQKAAVQPRYYDQTYVDALARRDIWITLAWSGDIFQQNNLGQPELRFVVPSEGAMFWTDNMLIPRNAAHPVDALELMDFVYRPRIAAMIADWVWFICPVPAAKPIIAGALDDPTVARSPLVFPGPDLLGDRGDAGGDGGSTLLGARVRDFYVYESAEEYAEWAAVFEPVIYAE